MEAKFRFPRPFRIQSGKAFSRIYREGRRARGTQMIVVGAPNGLGHPRLGLSVGKRIWKSAVKRNRIRRVFREAFRLTAPELPPLDLVLIPAEPKLKPNTPESMRELKRLAWKAHGKLEAAARTPAASAQAVSSSSGAPSNGPALNGTKSGRSSSGPPSWENSVEAP